MNARERILVLEDDPALRQSLVDVLEEEGYEVMSAGQGQQAVELAQTQNFELIITDVRMPGMDGLDALAEVKKNQPQIRSMVVSGYSSDADSLRALRLGVGLYLRKPFQLETLLESVQQIMAQRRQEAALQAKEKALRNTALWALETVAQQPGPKFEGLVGLGRRGAQMALECAMPAEASEEVQMTVLVGGLKHTGEVNLAHLVEGLPPNVRQTFEQLEERWDGQGEPEGLEGEDIPLAARIAGLLVRHRVGTLDNGACDPRLVEMLQRPSKGEERPVVRAGNASNPLRSLLQLAHMLEDAGDPGARRAYEEVLSQRSVTRESVEALLGLARIDESGRVERTNQACNLARQVSPLVYGYACLASGLLLNSEGSARLEEASRIFRQLRQPAPAAQADVALALRKGEDLHQPLEVLLEAPHQQELRDSASWLLPELLRRGEPKLERATIRLARQAQHATLRVLSRVGEKEKLALARVVRWDGDILKALEQDASPAVKQAAKANRDSLENTQEPEVNAAEPVVRLYTFGNLEIYKQEERISEKSWANQKVFYLVAFLAERGDRPSGEDLIVDNFWPDSPQNGRKSVYSAISTMRRQLGENIIQRTLQGITFNPEIPVWMDLHEYNRLIKEAGQDETEPALDRLRRAAQLYRGPFLESCYLDWAVAMREVMERKAMELLERLSVISLKQNRPLETLEHAYRLVEFDPCCQQGYLLLMQANMALGRPEAAVRLYEQCCKALKRELAMEPSTALMEAHMRAKISIA